MSITVINAGAGTGKTYTICESILEMIKGEKIDPSKIITTTFTVKAACELKTRIRKKLLEKGDLQMAADVEASMIGTVHSVCTEFIKSFSFEAGISPEVQILDESISDTYFNIALSNIIQDDDHTLLNRLAEKFSFNSGYYTKDWRSDIHQIVKLAWSNNITPRGVIKSGEKSVEEYRAIFEASTNMPQPEELTRLIEQIINCLNEIDLNQKASQYQEFLVTQLFTLETKGAISWNCWMDLSEKSPGSNTLKKSQALNDLVLALHSIAQNHATSVELWRDVQSYILLLFQLAAKSIDAYNKQKCQRCLIDFNDQEALFLKLLDNEVVSEEIRERYDVLIVDEFQDTNPMQLAIFLKLSSIVKKTIWVGDPKQAIYGFRGADPSLMDRVINSSFVILGDRLDTSYRSVEVIVNAVNSIFTQAFDSPLKETVPLKVNRKEKIVDGLQHWHFDGAGGIGEQYYLMALANSIKELMQYPPDVWDSKESRYRKLVPSDVAVLSRSNKTCEMLASSLKELGIEAAISSTGVLGTMEGKLVMACLKKLLLASDTLATAEILYLTSDKPDVEDLIENRLEWLHLEANEGKWGDRHPIMEGIEKIRKELLHLTPTMILEKIIEELQLTAVVKRWGRGEQRVGNVIKFYSYSSEFESACSGFNSPATLQGLILFLDDLGKNQLDEKPVTSGINAVNISTYHAAKGLEWPFVIINSLDCTSETRISQPYIIQDQSSELNIGDPLAGRSIRYWVNPYHGKKATWLHQLLQESEAFALKSETERQESKRLLYVGMTRAKDYLVLSSTNKNYFAWMKEVLDGAKDLIPSCDTEGVRSTAWQWHSKNIKMKTVIIPFSRESEYEAVGAQEQKLFDYQRPPGRGRGFLPFKVNPSKVNFEEELIPAFDRKQIQYLGERIKIKGKVVEHHFGSMFHAFMAIYNHESAEEVNIAKALSLLQQCGLSDQLEAEDLVSSAKLLYQNFLRGNTIARIYKEWPLQMMLDGQYYTGTADLIFETKEGLILIDHKSFIGSSNLWEMKHNEHYGQISTYVTMLENAFGKPVVNAYLHFPVGGGLLEVNTTPRLISGSCEVKSNTI